MLRISAFLLVVVLTGAPMAWAESSDDLDPNAIRQKIEGLRTLYTDEHPDVILLQRKLEKAEKIKRQRESRQKKLGGQPGAKPDTGLIKNRPLTEPPAGVPND